MIRIFGYGSLMSEKSAQSTMPLATNFQPSILRNFKRLFNLVSIVSIKNGVSNFATNELAALSIRASEGNQVNGIVFDIPSDELPAYLRREARYKPIRVEADIINAMGETQSLVECWTVVEQSDEEYRSTLSDEQYAEQVNRFYSGKLWGRKDILPLRDYLNNCIAAAWQVNTDFLLNFLDQTFLSDEITTIRAYLLSNPSRIGEINYPLFELISGDEAVKAAQVLAKAGELKEGVNTLRQRGIDSYNYHGAWMELKSDWALDSSVTFTENELRLEGTPGSLWFLGRAFYYGYHGIRCDREAAYNCFCEAIVMALSKGRKDEDKVDCGGRENQRHENEANKAGESRSSSLNSSYGLAGRIEGHGFSSFYKARCLQAGCGVERNLDAAMDSYNDAGDHNVAHSFNEIGDFHRLHGENMDLANRFYAKGARLMDPDSARKLHGDYSSDKH